jgi:hypothetical protein
MAHLALALAALFVVTTRPVSESRLDCSPVDLAEVQQRRADFGQVVFLFGDSIVRGLALGSFTPPADHPLWCFRSPGAVLATLQAENALGGYAFATVNGSELVEPSVIDGLVENGTIRDGDVIMVEDAGGHPHPPPDYRGRLLGIRRVATLAHAITVVALTTPDYIDVARHPESAPNRWNVEVDGMTHNAALRQGATEPIPGAVGSTILVDWQCHADAVRRQLQVEHGLDIFQPDGTHPNVLGQMQFVGLVLEAIGVPIESTHVVEHIAASAPGQLDHEASLKSATWGVEPAVLWVRRLLTQPRACP